MKTALFILEILLTFLVVYALLKFWVFFFVKYDARRKRLDASYNGKTSATKIQDNFLLAVTVALLVLLFISGATEYLSFTAGLFAGMTLIQVYFHRFSEPLSQEKSPSSPVSPIKMMSYAIQANPKKAWRELTIMTALFVWALYMLLTQGLSI
jgi:hypothetical protein